MYTTTILLRNYLLLSYLGSSLLMLDQLRKFSSTSISVAVHQELLNKLYRMMMDYRLKETVFSRV